MGEVRGSIVPSLCDHASFDSSRAKVVDDRARSGICKSTANGHMYGYYAKVGVQNLVFWGQIHRELADAVRDHILLSKMLEQIRCSRDREGFSSSVRSAVVAVLAEEGVEEASFLRTVTVRF